MDGRNERLWRPLANPPEVRISRFPDRAPRGFGLSQRRRLLRDYQDLLARYDRRPSLWVEPVGDWGRGHVRLVEIPTENEYFDNIVSAWVPEGGFEAGREYRFAYRLHWSGDTEVHGGLGRFTDTFGGHGGSPRSRFFALDAEGPRLRALPTGVEPDFRIEADGGEVLLPGTEHNPQTGGRRLAFRVRARPDAKEVRITAVLLGPGGRPLTETWTYHWTPPAEEVEEAVTTKGKG